MTIGSRRRITRETLFAVIPDYATAPSKDAAERMFERDKAEILELGLDLRTEVDSWDESVVTYRIARGDGELPALDLTAAEYTVLLAASRAWDEASAGGTARRVRAKLLSLGQEADPDLVRTTAQGRVESLPVLTPLLEAVSARRGVSFRYRAATGEARERRVEPWIVGVHGGRWYVLGYDLDRGAQRLFRASRIESFPRAGHRSTQPVPADLDLAAAVAGAEHAASERQDIVLGIAPYKALALRDAVQAPMDAERVVVPQGTQVDARRLVLGASRWVSVEAPAPWRDEIAEVLSGIAWLHASHADDELPTRGEIRARAAIRTPTSSTDHLSRLIAEASYVLSRGQVELCAMAADFGITAKRLIADLEILFVCGDLGTGWEDLIDVEWEDGWVRVRNADALQGPLRLSAPEVTTLLAGLGALAAASGEETATIRNVQAKLCGALASGAPSDPLDSEDRAEDGGARESGAGMDGRRSGESRTERIVGSIQHALGAQEPLALRYSPPDRAGAQLRRVRPARLETVAGRAYLIADDLALGEQRTFRIDRIVEIADLLDSGESADIESAADARGAVPSAAADDTRDSDAAALEPAWLRLEPAAAWIAEAFEAAEIRDLPDGAGAVVRIDAPVHAALVDAVMEAAGAAELLMPTALRDRIVTQAREAAARHLSGEPVG